MKISTFEKIDFNSITAIIFDWGGVITNISPQATIDAFITLGHHDFAGYFAASQPHDLFLRFETGHADMEEVYSRLITDLQTPVSRKQLNKALCAMLGDTPAIRLDILRKLRKKYRLFLLSNTNTLHADYYNNYLAEAYDIVFPKFFDNVYYSFEIGMRKPDPEIFRFVLEKEKLLPEKTLFIDDTEINIKVARSLNIHCCYLHQGLTIEDIFT